MPRRPSSTFPDLAPGTGARWSVSERATVFARIGTAGERALVPVDPDRLRAAERTDDAGGLVAELLQAIDDIGRHAVLELVLALVMQAARHIDRLLHVAAIIEDVGHDMGLANRLILSAHHRERHHRTAALGEQARHDRVQRALAAGDAIRMPGLDAEAAGAVLEQDAGLVRDDGRA